MKRILIIIVFWGCIIAGYSQRVNDYFNIITNEWTLSSIPRKQANFFSESYLQNDIAIGYNRAKISWYFIDPLFLRNIATTPIHIKYDTLQQKNHFVREIFKNEIYPESQIPAGTPSNQPVLNIAFYPNEKGAYNYDVDSTLFSDGIDAIGKLKTPESRWAGIMRRIDRSMFSDYSLNYLGFWLMDPFVYNSNVSGGNVYINIGNVSEDYMKDGKMSFEHGLPTTSLVSNVDTTIWGRTSTLNKPTLAFDNIYLARQYQDIGLDGLNDSDERLFFEKYINSIKNKFGISSLALQNSYNDPSSDNYHYYRGTDYDNQKLSILSRYKKYRNSDGNSPVSDMSPETYPTSGSAWPDSEDINRNNILDTEENYFQYKVVLKPGSLVIGQNFITDKKTVNPSNGDGTPVTWYKFLIPLNSAQKEIIGDITNIDESGSVRLILKDFSDSIVLRFFELAFVTNDLSLNIKSPQNTSISIYPNPSKGILTIQNNSDIINSIQIYDLLGHKITSAIPLQNPINPTIDLSFLENGMYFIVIETDRKPYSTKVIIQK